MKTLKEVCEGIEVTFHRIGFDCEKEQTRFVASINGQTFEYFTGLFACIPEKARDARVYDGVVLPDRLPLKDLERKLRQSVAHNYEHIYKLIRQGRLKASRNLDVPHVMYVFEAISLLARPTSYDLLSCLRSDSSAEGQSFADWCSEFGYDDDSIKALNIYNLCLDNAKKLRKALGNETFKALMEAQDE